MWTHLRFRGGVVEAKTETGRFTVDYLDLNDPAAIEHRGNTLHLIDLCEDKIREVTKILARIEQLFGDGQISKAVHDVESANAQAIVNASRQSLRSLLPT